jgi:hypothetical protein
MAINFKAISAAATLPTVAAVFVLLPAPRTMAVDVSSTLSNYATRVIDYCPAPGQFVNLDITTDTSGVIGAVCTGEASDGTTGATDGIVSLGAFGGYVVLGFDRPIENNPHNPYGVDFTIVGNTIASSMLNGASCEPAAVQVMKDINGNGIPDDGEWLELAGSDYWAKSTRHQLAVTYQNPCYTVAHSVPWEASDGATGAIVSNSVHTQPYYPDAYLFPQVDNSAYTLMGSCIAGSLNLSNPTGVCFLRAPQFGYADNHGTPSGFDATRPNNPYYADSRGAVTDGFDISWAVDSEGNYVELDQIDFIRIYTAGLANAGWLGEWSSEIDGVAITIPDDDYVPTDYYLNYIVATQPKVAVCSQVTFEGFLFKNGRRCADVTKHFAVDNEAVGTIDNDGVFTAISAGEVTISFSTIDGIDADEVTVQVVEPMELVVNMDGTMSSTATAQCVLGEQLYLNFQSRDNGAGASNVFTFDTYGYSSSKPKVGKIDAYGTFTALSEGSTIITAWRTANPNQIAEVKVTVVAMPEVLLKKDSLAITYAQPEGNWRTSTLFTTENHSDVTLKSVEARYGRIPCRLEGNRIVYDCSDMPDALFGDTAIGIGGNTVADVLDIQLTHYGVEQGFEIPVTFTRQGSGINMVTVDGDCTVAQLVAAGTEFDVFAPTGRRMGANQLPSIPGIYIVKTANATFKVAVR